MPAETAHHTTGSLILAVTLAATAGFVDAFVFINVTPVFVANMSGNLIRFGISAGSSNGTAVAATGAAIISFLAGVVLATTQLDRHLRNNVSAHSRVLLGIESLLLALLPTIMIVFDIHYAASIQPIDYTIVIIGSTAMGIQAVALRRVGVVAVSTTYGTGAVVRLGEKLALAARRTPRPGDHRRRVTILVLSSVLAAYVAGAWFAASIGSAPALLFIAPGATTIAAIGVRLSFAQSPSWRQKPR